MNKIIISLGLTVFAFTSCKDNTKLTVQKEQKIEVEVNDAPAITLAEINKPVFFDFTSTGCPGCGSWGAPTFENMSRNLKNDIVPVAVHIKYGDPMITGASKAIANNRTGQYFTPQLWINNTNGVVLSGNSINGSASILKINSEIETFQSIETSMAVGVSQAINGDKLTIRYKTKALKNLAGEYWIGLYVMENDILYKQNSGAQNPFEHNHVIRVSNSGGFGDLIEDEALLSGSETEKTKDFTLNKTWVKDNLYVTVIVWKKEGENFLVVNANNNLVY